VLICICSPFLSNAQYKKFAEIHLSATNLENTEYRLDGPWEFYPFQLVRPNSPISSRSLVKLPHLWHLEGGSTGFASYRTQLILLNRKNPIQLSLYMPDVYSAYTLLINGERAGTNGVVGTSRDQEQPHWLPQIINFTASGDTTEIIIHISNFHHNKFGIGKPITISSSTLMISSVNQNHRMELILFIALCTMALFSLIVYVGVTTKQHVLLFFSLLCFSWAVRTAFSNNYLAVKWFSQLDWNWVVRVEYLTLYSTTLVGLFFVQEFYPEDFNKRFRSFYLVSSALFSLVTIFTEPLFFTSLIDLYLAFSGLLIINIIIVLIRAFIQDRKGILFIATCIFIGACLFGYLIFSYENLMSFSSWLFNISFMMIFISCSFALWLKFKPIIMDKSLNIKSRTI